MQMYTLQKSTEESYELKRLLFGLFLTHFAPFHFFHIQKENQRSIFDWALYIVFQCVVDDSGYLGNIANNSVNLMILVLQKVLS